MIKVISLLRRKDGMTREEFARYWEDVHGPMLRTLPAVRRYIQSHIVIERPPPVRHGKVPEAGALSAPAGGGRSEHGHVAGGTAASFWDATGQVDGIVELWFDDLAAFERSWASPVSRAVMEDASMFIGAIKSFIVDERTIIPAE